MDRSPATDLPSRQCVAAALRRTGGAVGARGWSAAGRDRPAFRRPGQQQGGRRFDTPAAPMSPLARARLSATRRCARGEQRRAGDSVAVGADKQWRAGGPTVELGPTGAEAGRWGEPCGSTRQVCVEDLDQGGSGAASWPPWAFPRKPSDWPTEFGGIQELAQHIPRRPAAPDRSRLVY